MEKKTSETGIGAIGAVPWGTHICLFYDTKQDLIDTLVPYFKTGLENNEFCIWVASEYLRAKEAEEAIRKAVPNFTQYQRRGQIEIVPYDEWYLKEGAFNPQRVIRAWSDKLNHALTKGYDGMRVTGDMAWLGKKDWREFADYEEEINKVLAKYRMLAICTYSLDTCGASEIIDVVGNHQAVLMKREDNWILSKPIEGEKVTLRPVPRRPVTPLQQRFVDLGLGDFSDLEILELLLSLTLPYQKSRKRAKECLAEFKDLAGFLAASPDELERVGVTPAGTFYIRLLHALPAEILKKKIIEQPYYKSSQEVFDYLYYSMRDLKKEILKAVFLNSRSEIIDTVDLFEGTLESIPIHPREIVESAIKHGTVAIIFVHNHPSGDPAPSKSDKQFTRDLVFVGDIIQIKVLDHIIIGGNSYFSFADEGLIKKYELDFLNLKIRTISDSRATFSHN